MKTPQQRIFIKAWSKANTQTNALLLPKSVTICQNHYWYLLHSIFFKCHDTCWCEFNAINVFQPMGYSPIPTDTCLVGLDGNSVDKFDNPEQSPVYITSNPSELDYKHSPCTVADLYDWTDDKIDNVCTIVDTGAMVICTGTKHIIHHYKPCTKLKRYKICLKAALSSNDSVIPEGHGFIHICSADGYCNVLVYYHPSITGTFLSPTSVINARELNGNFTGQSIHRWFDNNTMLSRKRTLVSHHCWLKAQNTVIHGCPFGGQLYTHPLIVPNIHPNDHRATLCNSFQLARTQDKSFIDSCKQAVETEIVHAKAFKHKQLNQSLCNFPQMLKDVNLHGLKQIKDKTVSIYAIKAKTQKLPWHQRWSPVQWIPIQCT